jgi:2-alkenal reductase
MERQSCGPKLLLVLLALCVVVPVVVLGSCLVGALVAPQLRDMLPWTSTAPAATIPQTRDAAPAPTPTPVPRELLADADAEERLVAGIYERVAPSVVHIRVVQHIEGGQMPRVEIPGWPDLPGLPEDYFQQGEGSGFVWDTDGHIVTNYHVVQNAEKVEVTFLDGAAVPAEIVGTDADADLAVLEVEVPEDRLQPAVLGESGSLFVGQRTIAIGNPFGQEWSLTTGVVSALGRTMPSGASQFSIPEMIQTDAAINPGNSGGPLLDRNGHVIGVNTMILSQWQSSAGVGFAIPVDIVRRVVPVLIEEGHYTYAWLGIAGRDLDRDTALAMDLSPEQRGTLVLEVTEGGPAEDAGLLAGDQTATIDGVEVQVGGDVIVAVEDEPVLGIDDLVVYLVSEARPGQEVTLAVLRDGKELQIDVTLGERPD